MFERSEMVERSETNCPNCNSEAKPNGFRTTTRHGRARRYICPACKDAGLQYTFYGPVQRATIAEIKLKHSVKRRIIEHRFKHWQDDFMVPADKPVARPTTTIQGSSLPTKKPMKRPGRPYC
jgi:hypothetical protein